MPQYAYNLYSAKTYQGIVSRLNKLKTDQSPLWGKMNAAQMLAHCAETQGIANGKNLKNTPLLFKVFGPNLIKKTVLSKNPYKKNLKTHPQYKKTQSHDFDFEKQRLLTALEQFYSEDKSIAKNRKHPVFGKMTLEEKGWLTYKHLNHHFEQFEI